MAVPRTVAHRRIGASESWAHRSEGRVETEAGSTSAAGRHAVVTATAGIQFGEGFPRLAKRSAQLAVLRSLTSSEGNHARASHLMHSGHVPRVVRLH